MTKKINEECGPTCAPRVSLEERPQLACCQAEDLMGLFKVLANCTRLRMLHALARRGSLGVVELAAELGMKPQAVSNQLQKLHDQRIVAAERSGNNVNYRIVNRCVISLLDYGLCIQEEAVEGKS